MTIIDVASRSEAIDLLGPETVRDVIERGRWAAQWVLKGHRRFYLVDESMNVKIESSMPWNLLPFGDEGDFVTSDPMDDLESDALEAWRTTEKHYQAGRIDQPGPFCGRLFVDSAAASVEDAEVLIRWARGGRSRDRAEMLSDPEHPGLQQALLAWERCDDAVSSELALATARHILSAKQVALDSAALRWCR